MVKKLLVVAAALLTCFTGSAKAADNYEHKSGNAQKLLATLDQVGINSQKVKDFVNETNANLDGKGGLTLAERNVPGGKIVLRFAFRNDMKDLPISHRRLELRYTPTDYPNVNIIARTNLVMVRYHVEF
jgi:hypothetical protein